MALLPLPDAILRTHRTVITPSAIWFRNQSQPSLLSYGLRAMLALIDPRDIHKRVASLPPPRTTMRGATPMCGVAIWALRLVVSILIWRGRRKQLRAR